MNIFTKSVALAATMTVFSALTAQFTRAQSVIPIVDCISNSPISRDCAPNSSPIPPQNPNINSPQAPFNDRNTQQQNFRNQSFQNRNDGWQYDPRRHHRQNFGDNVFRFNFGGFYYDQPYWQQSQPDWQQSQPYRNYYRISCAQGRSIVAANGFNHVGTISCGGLNYTYQASRFSHRYTVNVNSRRGTIASVNRY